MAGAAILVKSTAGADLIAAPARFTGPSFVVRVTRSPEGPSGLGSEVHTEPVSRVEARIEEERGWRS